MLQQCVRAGSILLVVSASLYAMERATLKELAIKKVAALITQSPSYFVKARDMLPNDLSIPVIQYLMVINKDKSALPIALLSYKLHQQQNNTNQRTLRLMLSNDQQLHLTSKQSKELIQASVTIQNLIRDLENNVEEMPLPLLTQEQVTALLEYLPITNALNISDSILPMLQQGMPEAEVLSYSCIKYAVLQQLKEYLAAYTIPTLCNLIIAASYLDIQDSEHTVNFAELATQALSDKLLQSPQYQEDYNTISTLPANVQRMLVHYLIDNSAIRFALCGNSTDVITNTVQTLTDHTAIVNSVSWSPDGKDIASGSHDKTIRIWDASNSTCIRTLTGHTNNVSSVSWSPDGKYIASGSADWTVKIWDAITSTCIKNLNGHTHNVVSVSWSPNGKYVASASRDNTIRVWDANTGTCIHILKGHTRWVTSVLWSINGSMIASSSFDRTIKIWDACSGICIYTLKGHTNSVVPIAWSPDGKYIASGSDDKTIKIWNTSTGTCIHTLKGHTGSVMSVSWLSNSKYIVSGFFNGTIKIWNAGTGSCIRTFKGHTDCIRSLSWSSDSSMIASSSWDETIKLWNIIDSKLDNYLKTTLSWEQALLLARILTICNDYYYVDLAQDKKALHCYNGLDEQVKHLIEPLLSKRTHIALNAAKKLARLIRANPVRAALFGVGLEVSRKLCTRELIKIFL